jgi:hypothetical protein
MIDRRLCEEPDGDSNPAFGTGRVMAASILLRQDKIAQLAGRPRPTANRVLRTAEDVGIIRLWRGHVVIFDP